MGRQPFGLASPAAWLRAGGGRGACGGLSPGEPSARPRQRAGGRGGGGRAHARRGAAPPPRGFFFPAPSAPPPPPPAKYARLQTADGRRVVVGYTEASRGCRHMCRHCPIVPIYNGQFRVVAPEIVLADIAAQVAAGAGHITFGDPDFFNGPTHAMRVVEGLHAAHPHVSYDVTIKVEHLLRHRQLLPRLADTGCAFVTSAVESIDDAVLALLDKGHTRRDFVEAVAFCRAAGLTLAPTLVAFHPWLPPPGHRQALEHLSSPRL